MGPKRPHSRIFVGVNVEVAGPSGLVEHPFVGRALDASERKGMRPAEGYRLRFVLVRDGGWGFQYRLM